MDYPLNTFLDALGYTGEPMGVFYTDTEPESEGRAGDDARRYGGLASLWGEGTFAQLAVRGNGRHGVPDRLWTERGDRSDRWAAALGKVAWLRTIGKQSPPLLWKDR